MSKVYRKYRPRILKLLNTIKAALEAEGYVMAAPFDMTDEEYQWWMTGALPGGNPNEPDDKCFDISVTIIEEKVRDGPENAKGVSFSMGLCGWGGEIIGGLTPFNYSDQVWVNRKNPEDVEARWELFQDACDPDAIVSVIKDHYSARRTA